jgi:hypothetical protein
MEWVLIALRLIEKRALLNGREQITLGDIEWAIQELEREIALTAGKHGDSDG